MLLLPLGGVHWFALWLLDRVLREIEDNASPARDQVFTAHCLWCRALMSQRVTPGDPPPAQPEGALGSRRWAGYYWCSMRCWAEHWTFDSSVGYPSGEEWDAMLDAEVS